MQRTHEANRANWNAAAGWWREKEDQRGHWMRSHRDPGLVLCAEELAVLRDIGGKDACVLGSGDNEVAFALAGMGAAVTSVDISERRLEIAAERAQALGIRVTFLRADVVDLSELRGDVFDVVYTGGHVSVWVSDIRKYYAEAVRILRPGGAFIVNEYHPIRRMWTDGESLAPRYRYFDRGPYEYGADQALPSFEYHWTLTDHAQAVLEAGCALVNLAEYGEEKDDLVPAELAMLPTHLLIIARKAGVQQRLPADAEDGAAEG
jgi:SAM-dependent methyltransferase